MTDSEHILLLRKSVDAWNARREAHPLIRADLREANLNAANLQGALLRGADLGKANLNRANLSRAILEAQTLARWISAVQKAAA